MRLRGELSVGDTAQGFEAGNDMFQRLDLALRLTGLFEKLSQGSVCLLDGRWGTGKSTFVKQWAAELKKRNVPSIYFDAFASDYIDSPFQAIAGAFVKAAIDARRNDEPSYKTFLTRAAAVGKALAVVSAKVGVKAATLGVVSVTDFNEEVEKAAVDALSDASEETVKKLLEEHANANTRFLELKRSLEDLPFLLLPIPVTEDSAPLVVFIDELDRCRPDFALGIIEVLKHFFRADGVHYVLVTNAEHLRLSVAHKYGSGDSAVEYLEKFYDFIVHFDTSHTRYSAGSVRSFVTHSVAQLLPQGVDGRGDVVDYIEQLSSAFRLTLRQIQSFSINVALSYIAARPNELRPAIIVCCLALMKAIEPSLFAKARQGTLRWQEARDFFARGEWERDEGDRIAKVFQYHSDKDINVNDDEWRGWGNSLFRYSIERHNVIQYVAVSIVDRFGAPSERTRVEQ